MFFCSFGSTADRYTLRRGVGVNFRRPSNMVFEFSIDYFELGSDWSNINKAQYTYINKNIFLRINYFYERKTNKFVQFCMIAKFNYN